jgi:hypothetical protein
MNVGLLDRARYMTTQQTSISDQKPLKKRRTRTTFPRALRCILSPHCYVVCTDDHGECGPDAISLACRVHNMAVTVSDIRGIICRNITDDNFDRQKTDYRSRIAASLRAQLDQTTNRVELQTILSSSSYYLDNDDIAYIGYQLGIFIIIVNQVYHREQFGHLSDNLVLLNPFDKHDHCFLTKIRFGESVDTLMLYNQSAQNAHYELIMMKRNSRHTAIHPFTELPKAIRECVHHIAVSVNVV